MCLQMSSPESSSGHVWLRCGQMLICTRAHDHRNVFCFRLAAT